MRLSEIAEKIGAKVLTKKINADAILIDRIYAGDTVSDMLKAASDTILLVTNLSNTILPRVAELMDVPGICLVKGVTPDPDILSMAEEHGTVVLVSPVDMFETCGRLYVCFDGKPNRSS
jgi:hypothetical protein